MRDKELWQRIESYAFPMSDGRSLASQLVEETCLTKDRAERAVMEYGRFAYLVVTGDEVLAPSPLIDRIWHQHLLDTKVYQNDFCAGILCKTLHHSPGRPSAHKDSAYSKTLEVYRAEFGNPAPFEIWPTPETMEKSDRLQQSMPFAVLGIVLAFWWQWMLLAGAMIAIVCCFLIVELVAAPWRFEKRNQSSGCGGSSGDGCGGGCGGD